MLTKVKTDRTLPTHGFTLLEILVVLVIVTLVSTLLLQGFSYSLNLREKVLRQLGRVQNNELVESWFRKSTASFVLREKRLEDPLFFKGSVNRISGDTLFSLDQPIGVLTTIEWILESDADGYVKLFYTSNYLQRDSKISQNKRQQRWQVAKWLAASANFTYLDKDRNWHQNWPPNEYPDELPTGIMLSIDKEIRPFFWYSRILGDKKAPIIYQP